MIAHWMLYVLAVGALVTLGALAMEAAMRAFRLPQRWVWAAALVLSLAIPAAARWMPRESAPPPPASAGGVEGRRIRLGDLPAAAADDLAGFDVASLDRPLAAGWMALSGAAVLALLGAAVLLERRRRGWRATEVDGEPVLLSADTGPAVVGLFRSRIVLPEWVVREADPDVRALLLEHEREHLRASDPRLLALALAVVAAAPWNPAAWYQLRRLRLAMEVDCDARVLARRADVRAYGSLLLEVGRRGTGGRLAAAAFSEPVSFLERRIRIMTSPRARFPMLRAGGFGAVALLAVVAACEAPGPVHTSPTAAGTRMEPARSDRTVFVEEIDASPARISRADIDAAVRAHYPEVLRAAPGDTTRLMFVLTPDGQVARHERLLLRRAVARPERMAEVRDELVKERIDADSPGEVLIDAITFSPGQMGPGLVEVVWARELTEADWVTVSDITREPVPPAAARERSPLRTEVGISRRPEHEISAAQAGEYVRRYLPQVAAGGTTAEFVWFLADATGAIIGHGDSTGSEPLNTQIPNVENMQVFKGENVTINGHEIPVVYARLKR